MKKGRFIAILFIICFMITPLLGCMETTQAATTTIASNKIKKMVIAYGSSLSTDTKRQFIASHFDVMDCSNAQTTNAKTIKSLSPSMIILAYFNGIGPLTTDSDWSYINSHESWFAHSSSGARIKNTCYGYYLMNPSSSGWQSYFATRTKSFLTKYPQFSGVFFDNCPLDLKAAGYTFSPTYSSFASGILSGWSNGLTSQMAQTKTAVGSKIVMPNAWKYTSICEKATKATFWENFIHGRSKLYSNNGYSLSDRLNAINLLHKQAELGNIIAVNSGCLNADSYPTAAKQWQKFTLACFMFTVVDLSKAYYSWQFSSTDSSKGYFIEMDTQFGSPVSDYKLVIKNTYSREFKYYYVVANLDTSYSSSFTVNGVKYTLAANNALFIKK